jgi:L-lactate dehydrogenase
VIAKFRYGAHVTIGGIPIAEYCNDSGLEWNREIRADIAEKTRVMGSQIVAEKRRTHFGIATCVCQLADIINI